MILFEMGSFLFGRNGSGSKSIPNNCMYTFWNGDKRYIYLVMMLFGMDSFLGRSGPTPKGIPTGAIPFRIGQLLVISCFSGTST